MIAIRAVTLSFTSVILLSACEQALIPGAGGQSTAASDSATIVAPLGETVRRDVERPDIFSTTENALWDGRPSLGGVWVAHPDVGDPERVTITNTGNGRSVSGALFRRERNNPGPRIQVSSDAANALGLLAGQPTELSVVVVRSEEVEIAPPPVTDIEDATTPSEDSDANAPDVAVPAAAAAAVAVAEADIIPAREIQVEAADVETAEADTFEAVPAPAPIDLDALAAATAAIIAAEFADEAAAAAALAEAEALELEAAENATAVDATVPDVETDALDPIAVAAAAIDEAETESRADPAVSSLKNPFVQVGLFKQEPNADAAAASLRQAGIVPEVKEGSNQSGPYWRVMVGPMNSAEDQAALLSQIKGLGYRDAFLTTN